LKTPEQLRSNRPTQIAAKGTVPGRVCPFGWQAAV